MGALSKSPGHRLSAAIGHFDAASRRPDEFGGWLVCLACVAVPHDAKSRPTMRQGTVSIDHFYAHPFRS